MTIKHEIYDLNALGRAVVQAPSIAATLYGDGWDTATQTSTGLETGSAILVTPEDILIEKAADDYLGCIAGLPSGSVAVQARHGRIEVSGEFETAGGKEELLAFITRLSNVAVIDDTSSVAHRAAAKQLSDDILCTLHTSWQLNRSLVRVTAIRGRVRLIGTVRSPRERWLVESSVWSTPGVLSVESNITIAPALHETRVHVEESLHRSRTTLQRAVAD